MKRGDLIFVVLLLGCSPHFESGKTQCSDKGECPSGFICLNNGASNLCYDSNTPPFTGGAGGRAGTGGVVATTTGGQGGGMGGSSTSSGGTAGRDAGPAPTGGLMATGGSIATGGSSGGTAGRDAGPAPTGGSSGGTAGRDAGPAPTGGSIGSGGVVTTGGSSGGTAGRDAGPAPTGGSIGSGGVVTTGGSSGGTGGSCTDPSYPIHCDSLGPVPAGCWGPGTVCSTIANCGTSTTPDYVACGIAGYHPDCSGTTCVPNTGGSGGAGGTGGSGGAGGGGGSTGTCPPPEAGGTCNVFPACGCPAGQVCYPNTKATGLKCFPSGGLADGTDCSTGDLCASGFGCFGSICKRYCQLDSDCPAVDGTQSCNQTYWDSVNTIAGVSICSRVCDPVNPQSPRSPLLACPVGFGCSSMDIYPGASDCELQLGFGIAGSVCSTDADCIPGYYCSGGGSCIKYCFTSVDCPVGLTCHTFSTPEYAGTKSVGYCN